MGPGGFSSVLANQSLAAGEGLYGQAEGIQGTLTPFFRNELYNPQGYGPTTLSQIMTQSGQSAAGALGGARQSATDYAARTGNEAAIPQIIGAGNKDAIKAMSDLSGKLGIDNANERLSQVQQGASGLSGFMGEDLKGGLGYGNVANDAIKNLQDANNSGFMHELTSSIAGIPSSMAGGFGAGLAKWALG
jgi:hypothetical protein